MKTKDKTIAAFLDEMIYARRTSEEQQAVVDEVVQW